MTSRSEAVLDHFAADGLAVMRLRAADPGADAFGRWVVDGSVRLLEALRRRFADAAAPPGVAIVVALSPTALREDRAAAEAAFAAVRGIVQSLTLELGPRARINVIRCGEEHSAALAATLAFLASEQAGFVAGSTFDLGAT